MIDPDLRARVERWRSDDPDPSTVEEVDRLLAAADETGLRERFDRSLTFGTAGLRGPRGAGPNRMNRAVVRRTAAALARWLDEHDVDGPVVIGRDARHGSAEFASDSAAVIAATGREVIVSPEPEPTPLLAFAVRHLGAAAGVMVTASHNPAADNGYKVYAGNGAQIVPPDDSEIAAHIDAVGAVVDLPLAPPDDPAITEWGDDVREAYLTQVAALRRTDDRVEARVAYTPMHGVGADLLLAAFDRSSLRRPALVEAQARPDPDFPTAPFPNPEEPGALDQLLDLARREQSTLAIANDPDADRLAVAIPTATGWRVLTGDEIGILLADHLLRHTTGDDRLVATTVVSSSMLAALAAAHGVHHAETLTGFKWLAAASMARPDLRFVLGYEEALGYSTGEVVRDKDGISAAVVFTELVAALEASGSSVEQRLDDLAAEHGVHLTAQWTRRFEGVDGVDRMASSVERLRSEPPAVLGDVTIDTVEDLRLGERLPPTDAVVLRGRGLRVIVRPSGTEPKLKAYVEVVSPPDDDLARARDAAARRLQDALDAVSSLLD